MRYLSVCSGIEAATVAWHPLGWKPVAFSEIEKFPSAVLAHHYPDVPNLGDMTKILESEVLRDAAVDLLVGGTPCQSFSVAGLRAGMADPRGNLALVYLGLVDRIRPRWVVWENVPGVLSSWSGPTPPGDLEPGQEWEAEETSDFGCFIDGLAQLGYGCTWTVLDAQYFGLAQRRERVFVVGYLGDWRPAAAVLLEPESMRGDSPPSRAPGAGVAALTASGVGTCGADDNQAQAGHLIPAVASCITAREGKGPDSDITSSLIVFDPTQITSGENRSNPQPGSPCHRLAKAAQAPAVAYGFRHRASANDQAPVLEEAIPTLRSADDDGQSVVGEFGVRRLTPRECERLQGFEDDYTLIPGWRMAPLREDFPEIIQYLMAAGYDADEAELLARMPDGPRYKAIGNSMAVPVMRWIGERIAAVDASAP